MTEHQLTLLVHAACDHFGLDHHHDYDSRSVSMKGWPDWEIKGPGGTIYRELKVMRSKGGRPGQLTREQRGMIERWQARGDDIDVWYDSTWRSGNILLELWRLAPNAPERVSRERFDGLRRRLEIQCGVVPHD